MEKDGQTRLYYYHAPYDPAEPYTVREAWPKSADQHTVIEAKETHDRAEYVCVSVIASNKETGKTTRKYWSVHPKGEGKGMADWFDIDQIGQRYEENYANLAAKLEEAAGKKGLTVLVG